MESTNRPLPDSDNDERLWALIESALESFTEAWEQSSIPPLLAELAPQGPPAARRLALVEMVKVDMEYRRQRNASPRLLEQYVADLPELIACGGVPVDLIYEEYNIRRQSGDVVRPQEYFERFPDQADSLRHLLGLGNADESTRLFPSGYSTDLQPGETIDDFDLLMELGRGAFGSVFLARQQSLQRLVALKVSANQGTEPQTLAQLDHPHIVRVYDQRLLPDRNLRLLYMKYVPGGTLSEAIACARQVEPAARSGQTLLAAVDAALDAHGDEPPLESAARDRLSECDWPSAVCRIGAQLAEALGYAHRHGVLHRDLKPANVLLTAEGSPQLVDFNISFCSELEDANPVAYFGGSLAYMSPEQLQACDSRDERTPDSLDGRSDIYSLGVVLWELLTGRRPFADEPFTGNWTGTLEEMIRSRALGPHIEELDQLPFDVPQSVRTVLLKMLALDPDRRPSDGEELVAEFRLCLHPEAYRLLRPSAESWSRPVRRWALTVLMTIAVLPNALAGWFNYVYNRDHIIARLQDSQHVFWNLQAVINGIAFPVGIGLGIVLCLSVVQAIRETARRPPASTGRLAEQSPQLRLRCLKLGYLFAWIGIVEWLIAGLAYPIGMQAAGIELTAIDSLHFTSSLVLCGLIAATYPFIGITAYAVHYLYPALIRPGQPPAAEVGRLRWVEQLTWVYLGMGLLLPMLAVAILVTIGSEQSRTSLLVLSIGSFVGCGLLFRLARRIQTDVAVLTNLGDTAGKIGSAKTAGRDEPSRLRHRL